MNQTVQHQNTTALSNYVLHLADTNLILAQRLCEWCGHGPVLEQDIALSNTALDLLGQTRSLYQYAGLLLNDNRTEDDLAFLRGEREFKNLLLCELPNGDFGFTVLRQFFYDAYQVLLLEQMQHAEDRHLAAVAEKSLKEALYHFKWSAEWVIRLGDGTEESHTRMARSLEDIWTYTGEMFLATEEERALIADKTIPDFTALKDAWFAKVSEVLLEATLSMPNPDAFMQKGGKTGLHTEALGFILTDMQYLQRQYPGSTW